MGTDGEFTLTRNAYTHFISNWFEAFEREERKREREREKEREKENCRI